MNKIWIEQCEAGKGIDAEFGKEQALAYLIGEKFINFLEASADHADFRAKVPAFVTEIVGSQDGFNWCPYRKVKVLLTLTRVLRISRNRIGLE